MKIQTCSALQSIGVPEIEGLEKEIYDSYFEAELIDHDKYYTVFYNDRSIWWPVEYAWVVTSY